MSDKSSSVTATDVEGGGPDLIQHDGIYSGTFIPDVDGQHRTQSAATSIAPDDAAAVTDLGMIPSTTEVKPENVGTLSLRYVDGVPQLVVSGGKAIPARLTVVDGSGAVVASYAAQGAPASATISARNQATLIVTPA